MTELEADVRRAIAGDRVAFGRVVTRFQEMAVGYALAWLRDPELARDAAQDAFIDAYLHLAQLQDPAAFPSWFRRIVMKHCDRRTRRKPTPSIEPGVDDAFEDRIFEREQKESLHRAIESLPEHEQIAVALHYLGDQPQQDVADFLELPLSTVKKRLHSARRRLERRIEMETERAPQARVFADRIMLFLAIRAGDVDGAAAIVDAHPELLEAEEQWSAEEALAGGLPLAHRLTPLIAAAAYGDRRVVEMLLRKGASVDRTCGCENRETALWTAALHGRGEIVRALLARGADPNARNAAGYTPAEVIALRERPRPRIAPIGPRIETGIRAIDLFCPLAPKLIVRVHGAAETGLMVLLGELARRFGDAGLRSIWIASDREYETMAAKLGISDCTIVRPKLDPIDGEAVFLFLEEGRTASLRAELPRLRERAAIVFVIEPWIRVTRGELEPPSLAPPYGAVIRTSPSLAAEGIYPAIDPESASIVEVTPEHERIRTWVRAHHHQSEVKRSFAQPFFTWMHQNGKSGEIAPLDETLARFAKAMSA